MSTVLKFKPISKSIIDVTGEVIESGYELAIPYLVFETYSFSTKMKLYCPSCNFLTTSIMLHAWSVTRDGRIVKKETNILSVEWASVMKFIQPTTLYWPGIQESNIQEFKYDMLFVVQPIIDIELNDLIFEIEADIFN